MFRLWHHRLLRLINLRLVVVILAVLLAVDGLIPEPFKKYVDALDSAVLRTAAKFTTALEAPSHITLVHVPDTEFDSWSTDILAAQELLALLQQIHKHDAKAVVGLLLERPLALFPCQAERLLHEIDNGEDVSKEASSKLKSLAQVRQDLLETLKGHSIVLGVFNGIPLETPPLEYALWRPHPLISVFPWWDVASVEGSPSFDAGTLLKHYPVLGSLSDDTLVVASKGDSVLRGFLQQFLNISQLAEKQAAEGGAHPSPQWDQKRGLVLGPKKYSLSYDGSIIPMYGERTKLRTVLKQMTLAAALREESLSGWVLIGRDNDVNVDRVAQSLASLGDEAYLYTPPLFPLARIVFLFLFVSFSLLLFRSKPVKQPLVYLVFIVMLLAGGARRCAGFL